MIVGPVPQAELHESLGGRQPAGSTAGAGTGDLLDEDHGNAVSSTDFRHPGTEYLRPLGGERTQPGKCRTQGRRVERIAADILRGDFTEAQPRRERAVLGLIHLGLAEGARGPGIHVFPCLNAGHAEEAQHLLGPGGFVRRLLGQDSPLNQDLDGQFPQPGAILGQVTLGAQPF